MEKQKRKADDAMETFAFTESHGMRAERISAAFQDWLFFETVSNVEEFNLVQAD